MAKGFRGLVTVLDLGFGEVNAPSVNSWRGSGFHAAGQESVIGELLCDPLSSAFSGPSPLELLMSQVDASLEKGA